jgi:hypothetical protein
MRSDQAGQSLPLKIKTYGTLRQLHVSRVINLVAFLATIFVLAGMRWLVGLLLCVIVVAQTSACLY